MFNAVKKLLSPSIVMPSPDWISEATNATQFTPDVAFIENIQVHILFLVDNHQSQFKGFDIVKDGLAFSNGHAFTRDKFQMWKKPLGRESFPVPILSTPTNETVAPWFPKPRVIKGELYGVRAYTLMELDKAMANTVQFVRRRVRLVYPYHGLYRMPVEKGLEYISRTERHIRYETDIPKKMLSPELIHKPSAWMYVGRDEYWADQMGESAYDSRLKVVRAFEPKRDGMIRSYYQFTKNEIQAE